MGMKNLVLTCVFLFTIISIISVVNAEIIISQPKSVYSLGDELGSSITIDSIKPGYMDIDLVCPNGEQNIYHSVPEAKIIPIKRKLIPIYIENLTGSCYLNVNYADEIKAGQMFEISNSIEINIMTTKTDVQAGTSIQIKGTAYKKNNQLVGQLENAFVEISVDGDNLSSSGVVKDGQFTVELFVPESTHAGEKYLTIKIYDKDDSNELLNYGKANAEILVLQQLARIALALDKTTINPGENITIIPFSYDGAGDYMPGLISLKIIQNEKTLYEGALDPDLEFVYNSEKNNEPGVISVLASKETMTAEKSFSINAIKNLTIEIGNETLIITNVGNVDYIGDVEIKIGSQSFLENIDLGIQQSLKYALSAPDGIYGIAVQNDEINFNQNGISLTGNAIDINKVRAGADYVFARYPVVWIFLLVILALAAHFWYKRYKKNRKFGTLSLSSYNRPRYKEIKRQGGVQVIKPEEMKNKIDSIVLQGEMRKAEQVLVLHGKKNPAAIIAIKIKSEMHGIANDSFRKSLEYAYKNKAVAYNAGDYYLLIFSPLLTKSMKNEEVAIKAASDIDGYLKDHNRKFRNDKIAYGIGVNTGEIINKVEGRVLQFTNVGKTINAAKRVAEVASDEVLLTKELHEKTPTVKTEKFASGAIEAFSVKRIVNSEQSQKFINEFMRRNTTL